MLEEMPSLKHQYEQMQTMNFVKIFLKKEDREKYEKLKSDFENLVVQMDCYNKNFSDRGWIVYDLIKTEFVENANKIFENEGMDEAEKYILNYYTNDVKSMTTFLYYPSKEFKDRTELIKIALDDHFNKRYYSSVLMFLTIVDGIINDFTKSKGFFAEGVDLDCWDCIVDCSNGLKKLKGIYNTSRKKTNTEEIYFPYRNGILHGRDLKYGNEYVSSKCLVMLFAISDWIKSKSTEDKRKETLKKELNPPPLNESVKRYTQIQEDRKIIQQWKPQNIIIGTDIPENGSSNEYIKYEYLHEFIKMLEYWKQKNYGKLAIKLEILFNNEITPNFRPKRCRELFEKNILKRYKLISVKDQAIYMKVIEIEVTVEKENRQITGIMRFGMVYEGNDSCALPNNKNGKWNIYPQDVRILYS